MTKVSREGTKVIIDFDTQAQAESCESQTKYMFEHPTQMKIAAKLAGRVRK